MHLTDPCQTVLRARGGKPQTEAPQHDRIYDGHARIEGREQLACERCLTAFRRPIESIEDLAENDVSSLGVLKEPVEYVLPFTPTSDPVEVIERLRYTTSDRTSAA